MNMPSKSNWLPLLTAIIALALCDSGSAAADDQDAGPLAARIDRLIAELDAAEYPTREAALDALAEIGRPAEAALRRAATDSPSLEVRSRAADLLRFLAQRQKPQLAATLAGHSAFVNSVAFLPDGESLVSGSEDASTVIWDLKKNSSRLVLRGQGGGVLWVNCSPDGKTIATAGRDGKVILWEAESGRLISTLAEHKGAVSGATFAPRGETLATCGDDRAVMVRESGGKIRFSLAGHNRPAIALAYSADGKTLYSGGGNFDAPATSGELCAWNLTDGKLAWQAAGDFGGVWGLSASLAGKHLAGACLDGTVRVWDVAAGKERFILRGHSALVIGVSYTPSGRLLASSSYDGTVRLWNGDTGEAVATIPAHAGPVQRLAFSRDGKLLATCGNDRLVKVWRIPD